MVGSIEVHCIVVRQLRYTIKLIPRSTKIQEQGQRERELSTNLCGVTAGWAKISIYIQLSGRYLVLFWPFFFIFFSSYSTGAQCHTLVSNSLKRNKLKIQPSMYEYALCKRCVTMFSTCGSLHNNTSVTVEYGIYFVRVFPSDFLVFSNDFAHYGRERNLYFCVRVLRTCISHLAQNVQTCSIRKYVNTFHIQKLVFGKLPKTRTAWLDSVHYQSLNVNTEASTVN